MKNKTRLMLVKQVAPNKTLNQMIKLVIWKQFLKKSKHKFLIFQLQENKLSLMVLILTFKNLIHFKNRFRRFNLKKMKQNLILFKNRIKCFNLKKKKQSLLKLFQNPILFKKQSQILNLKNKILNLLKLFQNPILFKKQSQILNLKKKK